MAGVGSGSGGVSPHLSVAGPQGPPLAGAIPGTRGRKGGPKTHRFALWALKESVDGWPMAIIILKTFGGQPKPVAASGRDGRLVSSI